MVDFGMEPASMTDRELLELAAKAAGIAGEWGREGYIGRAEGFIPTGWLRRWNPLTDDGDALRLAVKLRIDVCFFDGLKEIQVACASVFDVGHAHESYGDDMNAATRRALVRAAALMGAVT
jgi:hypothetical protein